MVTATSKTARDYSELNSSETGMVKQNVATTENVNCWADLFRYQIKDGFAFVLDPSSKFSMKALKLEEGVDMAVADDGGAQTDQTAAANSAGAGDMTLGPALAVKDDAYFFGYRMPYSAVKLTISQIAKDCTVIWEYYNGAAWATITGLVDGTAGLTTIGTTLITFTPPVDWAKNTITAGEKFYCIRVRFTVVGGGYQQPLGTRAYVNSSEAMGPTSKLRIVLMDTSEEVRIPLLQPINYAQVTEFQDPNLMARLDISKPVVASTGLWLVIQAISKAGVIDSSASYFKLSTMKYHPVLTNQR
jgi:hypothetical protein